MHNSRFEPESLQNFDDCAICASTVAFAIASSWLLKWCASARFNGSAVTAPASAYAAATNAIATATAATAAAAAAAAAITVAIATTTTAATIFNADITRIID